MILMHIYSMYSHNLHTVPTITHIQYILNNTTWWSVHKVRTSYSVVTLQGVNITISGSGEVYTCTLNNQTVNITSGQPVQQTGNLLQIQTTKSTANVWMTPILRQNNLRCRYGFTTHIHVALKLQPFAIFHIEYSTVVLHHKVLVSSEV